jgi:phospholipase C
MWHPTDPLHPHSPEGAADWPGAYLTPVDMPDVILQGVARYRSEFRNHTDFYTRAADGTLPAVSWIHPPGPMMDHPCHDMALGERLHKDIYEALRSGPKWNKTLLAIVYDDGGDFYE